ncbi:MAG: NeuD/PglB/VioB family sugar acetyltransferase [Akkermansiaceae bacterium]|nr:NeuD/PglB/VioB family sugar acetyltransferase [Akkermansiaceae bacterium]
MEFTAIVGLGAGGHGRVIADILSRSDDYTLAAWLDSDNSLHGTNVCGARVLGNDSLLTKIFSEKISRAFIGLGSTGDASLRRKVADLALGAGMELPVITDVTALVSKTTQISEGVCIFPHAIINPGSHVGRCAIINTRATVEHDCIVGEFCHLAPACVIGGGCVIGNGAHIGIGAVIREGITIGKNVIVGAGAVVVSNIAPGTIVAGVPAKPLDCKTPN